MPWESRPVTLTKKQGKELNKIVAHPKSGEKEKMRAQVVLLLEQGGKNKGIAKKLGIHENTVVKWRGRWTGDNSEAKVADYGEPTGRPRNVLVPEALARIQKATAKKPPKPAVRWTVRGLASKMDLPVATMQRALVELGIDLTG